MHKFSLSLFLCAATALSLSAGTIIQTTNARFSDLQVRNTPGGLLLTGFVHPAAGIGTPVSAHVDAEIDGRMFRSGSLTCRHPRTACSDRHRFSVELPAGVDPSTVSLSYHAGTHG